MASIDLGNPINCAESTYNCTAYKVELKLAKAVKNENWSGVESGSSSSAVAPPISGKVPDYPSSSKNKKDWSKVDKAIVKETGSDKPEGDEALNGLFKQIYERSDEATKRAMIKSY